MTTTNKRLYGPQSAPTAATTLYTCASAGGALIRHIRLSNPSGSQHTFTLSIGVDATGTRIFSSYPVPGNGIGADIYGPFTLNNGDVIQGSCDNAAVVIEIDGQEFT